MNWKFWSKNSKNTKAKVVKKSKGREWVDAVVFAVIAATLIRTFFIEAYTIPTPSMERSLLVGDFLFVSKLNYGARTPMTPVAFPFAHHTMPITNTKAYWEGIKLPYYRLPGFSDVKKATL
ncbi:S26 family signal peptidase [Mucilaginibacter antarcticus]|uniref:S26 family signal peptidase n=1 Tax=Mucilaginibacter antarcticus TaxID=1855725 RepID=UPI00363DB423